MSRGDWWFATFLVLFIAGVLLFLYDQGKQIEKRTDEFAITCTNMHGTTAYNGREWVCFR